MPDTQRTESEQKNSENIFFLLFIIFANDLINCIAYIGEVMKNEDHFKVELARIFIIASIDWLPTNFFVYPDHKIAVLMSLWYSSRISNFMIPLK